ncbi:hypothetical protein [Ruegeria sp. THAF57]|uniref:hypothetical protein n=1 Tax=Ruegeria sp. THAF57 TaxID=2744555 RepID=UPI0015DFB4B8|nr:hypothetical protein [Ruegeria sp. THAF57]
MFTAYLVGLAVRFQWRIHTVVRYLNIEFARACFDGLHRRSEALPKAYTETEAVKSQ